MDRWLWKWCSAREALVGFLILNVLVLASSYLFPQAPAYVRSDPTSYREWVSTVQVRFKSWTPILDTVGLLNVYHTVWFRVLQAALAFVLLISLGNQLWTLLQKSEFRQADSFYDGSDSLSILAPYPSAQVADEVRSAMGALLGRIRQETEGDGGRARVHLYGSRGRWAAASSLVILLGLLLLVVGLAINARWGWRQPGVQLVTDQAALVGPQASHQIRLLGEQASPGSAILQVGESRPASVRLGTPTLQGGFRYQLNDGGGPFVQVHASRRDQAPLTLYEYTVRPTPVESLGFAFAPAASSEEPDLLFIVSQDQVVGRLTWLNSRAWAEGESPRFHLWVFHEDGRTLIGEAEIAGGNGAVANIGDVAYTFGISRYVVLDVAYQPGTGVLGAGVLSLLVGLIGEWVPRQQMWSVILPQAEGTVVKIFALTQGSSRRWRRQKDQTLARLRAQLEETA